MEISLEELEAGKEAVVKSILGGHGLRRRLEALGIVPGKKLRKVLSEPLGGPIVVEVDRSQIVLGRGMAKKILVESG